MLQLAHPNGLTMESSASQSETTSWKKEITPHGAWYKLPLGEIWAYRDLIRVFVKRDITAIYKQTVLGPIWFFLQPLLTTALYVAIFSRVGKFGTSGLPPALFYLSGLVPWLYFAECMTRTSGFLKDNQAIFSKVYFPRLVVPISLVLTNLVKMAIHLALFLVVYVYYLVSSPGVFSPHISLVLLPLFVLFSALFGLGLGLVVSSLTTTYKDLSHLVSFGVQLLMFLTPVIYPMDSLKGSWLYQLVRLNPVTGLVEAFRFGFFGTGTLQTGMLVYDCCFILLVLLIGLVLFNRVERDFVDTI
jgi:lipopolysaccharide transport system permease protein